jgi:probable rRNA maturation factor
MEDDPAYDIAVTVDCRSSIDDRRLRFDECTSQRRQVDDRQSPIDNLLREAIEATLRRHRTPTAQISVALVDDARMADLNRLHLKREGPTDVLAFDLRDSPPRDASAAAAEPVDGEIIVSVDTAAREAGKRGHGLGAELALYAVHGTLHLVGYSDRTEDEAARMHEMEEQILSAIGIGAVFYGADKRTSEPRTSVRAEPPTRQRRKACGSPRDDSRRIYGTRN